MSVIVVLLFGLAFLPYAAFFGMARVERAMKVRAFLSSVFQVVLTLLLLGVMGERWSSAPSAVAPLAEAFAEQPAPRCWEATVYLPLSDNQGRPFGESVWQQAMKNLVVPFGGATLGQPTEGYWLDARRQICREPVRPVVVSFAAERLDEFRRAVHIVGEHLGQEVVYVRFEQPRVELIVTTAAALRPKP
jgi:hypothetical protein